MRIGLGYDIHELKKGRKLILGGVEIPFAMGLSGHSDADVLSHAVCDALLGAAALGDIGIHFPNTDNKYKNISSLVLLEKVFKKIIKLNYRIVNIDTAIIADQPKLALYFPEMKKNISKVLKLSLNSINVKATTSEGCLFSPKKKAIISYAAVILENRK
ncbi:MAG: 2-C-methyl-D-erythritol 2,4-cyclodiphosphate synthase [bacterium]|nr:2-C-methyl-D-erythritol 2,4-cyclodiphosphate synthase [bacterium]